MLTAIIFFVLGVIAAVVFPKLYALAKTAVTKVESKVG